MKYTALMLSAALLIPVSSYAEDFTVSKKIKPYIGHPTIHYTVKYTGHHHYQGLWCGGTSTMSLSSTPTKNVFIVQDDTPQQIVCYSSPSSTHHTPANKVYEFMAGKGG
jgi:hypothetical protein